MKNKNLLEIIELSIIFVLIAIGFLIIASTGHDIKKKIKYQDEVIVDLKERIKKIETINKLYEYDLEQINEYHNSEVD